MTPGALGMDAPLRRFARPDGTPPRVLIVEDDPDIADALVTVFRYDGWTTALADNGPSAIELAQTEGPDVIVLDVMLPGADGYQVLARVREHLADTCVLFLSARDSVDERVRGITSGADDYVTKPFSLREVVLRARSLARRAGLAREHAENVIRIGELVIDEEAFEVTRCGEVIELSPTEYKVLLTLARHARRVVSKSDLLKQAWGYDYGGNAHLVELYISYLRRKIDAGRAPMIQTVRGVGYLIRAAWTDEQAVDDTAGS